MEILSAARQLGVGFKKLSADVFQLAVEDVEMRMSDKLTLVSHSQKLTASPQTLIVLYNRETHSYS